MGTFLWKIIVIGRSTTTLFIVIPLLFLCRNISRANTYACRKTGYDSMLQPQDGLIKENVMKLQDFWVAILAVFLTSFSCSFSRVSDLSQIHLTELEQSRPERTKKDLLRQVHSTLLASFVFISKEASLSQVSLGFRAKALGWGPRCTKGPGIPAVCL